MDNNTDEIETKTEILYHYLYGDIPGKIVLYSNLLLSSVIGPILILGIVIFEMFGGDSQKRTILNRLLSALLINIGVSSVINGIIRSTRDAFGLLDFKLALFFRISVLFFMSTAYIFYSMLTIFRYLYIVVWKRMRGVQDKFCFQVMCFSAYTLSFWFAAVFYITGFQPNDGLFIYLANDAQDNNTQSHKNVTLKHR